MSPFDRLKFYVLGRRISAKLPFADIISAESNSSLELLAGRGARKMVLSVNGSDDELRYLREGPWGDKENVAMVIGTYRYKALDDSFRVFEMLRRKDPELRLIVIGNEKQIPRYIKHNSAVVVKGLLARNEVIKLLRTTRIYISTTEIENSYNAASEGIFFAEESYISDIGPHRELLADMIYERISVAGVATPILRVKRSGVSPGRLKTWDQVIREMIKAI
jgi:glycosyltransferase involved in cell wall biosynthesis